MADAVGDGRQKGDRGNNAKAQKKSATGCHNLNSPFESVINVGILPIPPPAFIDLNQSPETSSGWAFPHPGASKYPQNVHNPRT